MKRVLLLLLVLVLVVVAVPGCSYVKQSNQPPKAYIGDISPTEVTEGDVVRFSGYGTDADGQVVGYRWRSDKDGQLAQTAEFMTSSLSVGEHTIYFRVQDNNDTWSEEASSTVTVLPAQIPAVAINAFTAPLLTISEGDSVTLSWNVANATEVSISPNVGTVPATGSVVVTPDETTVYTLTATGASSTAAASLTITVQPTATAIILTPNIDLTGFIRSSGSVTTGDIFVGDDESDRGIQAFLTYDISLIPDNAVITRVIVDLSGYEVPYYSPYPALGCLSAYAHDYTTLHGEYWWGGVPASIGEWCSLAQLDTPRHWTGFRNALQQRVGTDRFQVRLQFADMESDGDGRRDLLHWPRPELPRLTIEYYT